MRCATCDEIVIIHAEPAVVFHNSDGTHTRRSRKRRRGKRDRRDIRPGLREWVLVRDDRQCRYCGRYASTLDHVVPRAGGGETTEDNLVAACEPCNKEKGDKPVEEFERLVEVA